MKQKGGMRGVEDCCISDLRAKTPFCCQSNEIHEGVGERKKHGGRSGENDMTSGPSSHPQRGSSNIKYDHAIVSMVQKARKEETHLASRYGNKPRPRLQTLLLLRWRYSFIVLLSGSLHLRIRYIPQCLGLGLRRGGVEPVHF